MPAPHRLTSLAAARPDLAAAELQAQLDAHLLDVTATAQTIGLDRTKVHALIVRLGLRSWVEERREELRASAKTSSEQARSKKST